MISNNQLQNKKIILKTDLLPRVPFLFSDVYFNNCKNDLLEFTPKMLKLFYVLDGNIPNMLYLINGPISERLLNSSVLFFLYENPEYIPDSWIKEIKNYPKSVLFGGTIYSSSNGYFILLLEIWKNEIKIGYEDLLLFEKITIPFAII
ncbi:hypothetical protein [Ferruginibacter sp.]|nr:hypothetical protein [Ferruginibacter sp.]